MRNCRACLVLGLIGLSLSLLNMPAWAQLAPPANVTLPTPLTLDEALTIALAHQPQRYAALAQVNGAKGQKEEAVAQYFPAITPTYQFQSKSTSVFGVAANPNSPSGTSEVAFVRGGGLAVALDQTILDGGQREAANAEARHNLAAAEYGLESSRQTIIETVTQDYYNLLLDQDLVTVAQASVAEFEQTVAMTKAQINAGTEAANDIYQAQANLANAQVTLLQSQIAQQTASSTLKNAMGVDTDAAVQPKPLAAEGSLPPVPTAGASVSSLDDALQEAYEYRPDYLQQAAQVQSSLAAFRLARANAGLTVSADYLATYQATNDVGNRGVDSSLVVTGSYPFFDAGASRGAERAARGALDSAENLLISTRQQVRLGVEVAYNQRAQNITTAQLAQTAVQAAQVNYNSAVAGRKIGVGTILDVITAEQTLTQAQEQYVAAVYNFYIADAELAQAVGRNETPATMAVH